MSETDPRPWCRPWRLALIGVLVGYPLSPAPVLWMLEKLGLTSIASRAELYYWPLVFACRHVEFVRDFYDWQFRLLDIHP